MGQESFFTTRREFLSGGLTLLSVASTAPIFLGGTLRALADDGDGARHRDDSSPILVVVQLAGGNDGLNTIIPVQDDAYYRSRPRIAIKPNDALELDKRQGLAIHPNAVGLKELFDEGMMAVVQGIGYPNPNRSHFVSMDIWQTADPAEREKTGWLGRYFDAACKGADPDPVDGVALMGESPIALRGEKFSGLAFESPDALGWNGPRRDKTAQETFQKLNNITGDFPETPRELENFIQRAALRAQVGADEIRSAAGGELGGFQRRGGGGQLGRSLDMVAKMIAADLPTRVYYVSMGGFDTHTSQTGRHGSLMRELGDAMSNFVNTLKEQKLLDRVVVMTFSEFGRRVEENASGGTDHGAGAPMFLFGSQVRAGIHMKHPSLTDLDRGDLKFRCDFRRVYAGVLRDWLKVRPDRIVGRQPPLRIIDKS